VSGSAASVSLLPDFDHEMAVTRRVLEQVPDAALAWRPDAASCDLGGLASHLADIPRWGRTILERDSYDLAEAAGPEIALARPATRAAILETFDRHVADVRRELLRRSDVELLAPWSLLRGGQLVMSLPRLTALRSFLLHHAIHHRGQMTIYLRLQGVAVPPMYGATADEPA
jgi:uncharacterized damage-inducible protein DinB